MRDEWGFLFKDAGEAVDIRTSLSANNAEVLKECAIQGMGIVLLPRFIVEDAISDGRLRQVMPSHAPPRSFLYAVRPSRRFVPARVRVFVDFLKESFGEDKLLA
jgi:DNA-binding transcriptional LysR family regulator